MDDASQDYASQLEIAEGRMTLASVSPPGGPPEIVLAPDQAMAWALAEKEVGRTRPLPVSRSPILDAFLYCALKGWGADLVIAERDELRIHVSDFSHYGRCSYLICPKPHPTEELNARLKALGVWFPGFRNAFDFAHGRPFDVSAVRTGNRARFNRLYAVFRRIVEYAHTGKTVAVMKLMK